MNNDAANNAKPVRNVLIGVVVVVALLIGVSLVLLGLGVRWYLSPENKLAIVQRRDLVQGLASGGQALAVFLTGAVGLIGLFFTWQNTRQARDSTQRTLELTEQGQITDRFTKAIELLGATSDGGSKNLEQRLGGIYALEQIANESEQHYWSIIEILAAYIRTNTPQKDQEEAEEDDVYVHSGVTHADPDIQAILNIIGQRYREWDKGESTRINLAATDLRDARFFGANLTGVWFADADLRGASFTRANLRETLFLRADLRMAYFENVAIIDRTDFSDANLDGANVRGVNLERTVDTFNKLSLTQDQINAAFGDKNTQLPSSLKPPAHWAPDMKADEQREGD